MKKLLVCLIVVFTMLLTACGGGGSAPAGGTASAPAAGGAKQQKPEFTMICASNYNNDYHYVKQMNWLEKTLEERTKGRIDVQVFGNNTLVADDRQSVEMLMNDQIQLGMADTGMIATVTNDNRWTFSNVPYYLGTDMDKIYTLMDKGTAYQTLYKDTAAKYKFFVIGSVNGGGGGMSNTKRETNKMEAFKGLKIRVPEAPVYVRPVAATGANPTPMSFGEVYTGLQQGTVDGCFTTVGGQYTQGFFDFCKYVLDMKCFFFMHTFALSSKWVDSLPADLRPIVMETSYEFIARVRADCQVYHQQVKEALIKKGVTYTELTPEFQKELAGVMQPWTDEMLAGMPEFKKMIDDDIKKLW